MSFNGHHCEICDWTFRQGTKFEEHKFELIHWSLMDASTRMIVEEFHLVMQRLPPILRAIQ